MSNILFNGSLILTSISSNTILNSTSGILALILSIIFLNEEPAIVKFISVFFAVGGVSCIALSEGKSDEDNLIGDLLAFGGAVTFAALSVYIKGNAENIDLIITIGSVGVFNSVLMLPIIYLINITGLESFELPDKNTLILILINGIVGTLICDALWGKSI